MDLKDAMRKQINPRVRKTKRLQDQSNQNWGDSPWDQVSGTVGHPLKQDFWHEGT